MPRRTRSEELDRAVDAILSGDPAAPANERGDEVLADEARGDEELADLVAIAAALRGLPRGGFRDHLGAALRPSIVPHDLRAAVQDLPPLELRGLGSFDRATIGVFRFTGQAPWERHPDGDELIVVLEGGGEITVLGEGEPTRAELRPGRLFVCPRGLWHRPVATPSMTALYVTPLTGSEHSWADDPRVG
jgi:mannose-6-phosphate isomerase-like protein (cupin superfamily)